MRTDFYNIDTLEKMPVFGENFAKVFIYANGETLAELEEITEHTFDGEKLGGTVYDGTAEKVYIKGDIKKANKLNLNRKDNFYIKNPDCKYKFLDKPYILYLHVSAVVDFEKLGDVLASELDHEKCYLETYKITFYRVEFKRHKLERIICDNYTLKDGEQFSSCYGEDKNHPCIDPFEITPDTYAGKRYPEKIGQKGIIKKWFEQETAENHVMILTKRCYTKIIKDNYRTNSEKIAEKINSILYYNSKLSYYDIECLLKNGVKITFDED